MWSLLVLLATVQHAQGIDVEFLSFVHKLGWFQSTYTSPLQALANYDAGYVCDTLQMNVLVEKCILREHGEHWVGNKWFLMNKECPLHANNINEAGNMIINTDDVQLSITDSLITLTLNPAVDVFYFPPMLIHAPTNEFSLLQGFVRGSNNNVPKTCYYTIPFDQNNSSEACTINSAFNGILRPLWGTSLQTVLLPFSYIPELDYVIPTNNSVLLQNPAAVHVPFLEHFMKRFLYYDALFEQTNVHSEHGIVVDKDHSGKQSVGIGRMR